MEENAGVANAQHIKNVPGRKTDVKDCAWISDLVRHGLIAPRFVQRSPAAKPARAMSSSRPP